MAKRAFLATAAVLVAVVAAAAAYRHFVLVEGLRDSVREQLNDPDSARFRYERYVGDWTVQRGFLCGEVNAKNAMGGYVGYRPFATGDGLANIQSDVEREAGIKVCDIDESMVPWWWLRW